LKNKTNITQRYFDLKIRKLAKTRCYFASQAYGIVKNKQSTRLFSIAKNKNSTGHLKKIYKNTFSVVSIISKIYLSKIVIVKGTDLLPVIPHKAVAEVSNQEIYRKDWLKPLMDRMVLKFPLYFFSPFFFIFF
jgi:hypothetical protein